jgi:hypothetical protein
MPIAHIYRSPSQSPFYHYRFWRNNHHAQEIISDFCRIRTDRSLSYDWVKRVLFRIAHHDIGDGDIASLFPGKLP